MRQLRFSSLGKATDQGKGKLLILIRSILFKTLTLCHTLLVVEEIV